MNSGSDPVFSQGFDLPKVGSGSGFCRGSDPDAGQPHPDPQSCLQPKFLS